MGLDMYASTTKRRLKSPIDFTANGKFDEQIHYWRKHPDLHGWMERLYREKGGDQEFNCTTVQLTSEDIARLECVIEDGKLPETCGFFFGASDGSEREDDLEFIAKARAALAKELSVYYHAWW
jgi:hypothetical protein